MSKLSKEQVDHIALLARLELSEKEKVKFQEQLSSILDSVEKLNEVDTTGVEPMTRILEASNVTREDIIKDSSDSREAIFSNMPDQKNNLLKVPPVFESGGKI